MLGTEYFSKASRSQALLMSVRNGPGMMQFTRTLGPNARAMPTVMALRPALAVAYGSSVGVGWPAATLLTLMIEPPSPAAMWAPASDDRRNGPRRFTPITLSNRSSVTSGSGP